GGPLAILAHLADKSNPLARQGPYQALGRTVVPDGRACRVDAAAERRFRDDASIPYGGEQIVPARHAVSAADQEFEQVEDLRLELDELRSAAELTPLRVERAILEEIQHLSRSQETTTPPSG